MGRLRKFLIWITGFFVLFTIIGFFVLPPVVKSVLIKKLSENLHREVAIKEIKINPYSLTVTVRGFTVKDNAPSVTFVSFDELFLNVEALSVFKGAIIVKEVRIKKPYIQITRNKDESYNFSDLLEKDEPTPKAKAKPMRFSVNNISILEGGIDFFDGPKNTNHTIREMHIAIPFISNIPYYINNYVQPTFSARINGNPFALQGKTKPFANSLETDLDINIKDFDLPYYLAYVPMKMNFKLLSGAMDLTAKVLFTQYKDRDPSLTVNGNIVFKNIFVKDVEKNPLLRLQSADITLASFEPFGKDLRLAKIALQSPELVVRRGKNGELNLQGLIEERKGASTKKKEQKAPVKGKDKQTPSITVEEIQIKEGKILFHDLTPSEPVTLEVKKLNVQGENISTAKNSKAKLSLSLLLNKTGVVSVKGPIGIDPISASLAVDITHINISTLQSYFTDKIKINITGGNVNASGNLTVSNPDNKGLSIKYTGKVLIADLSTIDKAHGDDFLKWKALSFNALDVGYNPLYVHVNGISLADFYARLTINPDGTLNVQKILEDEEQNKDASIATPKKEGPAIVKKGTETEKDTDIKIGNITLQGGTIDFTDKMIKPSYSANLVEIGGRITGLSLKQNELAEVELRGKLNRDIPLEIVGKINPSKDSLFVDLTVKFKGFELSPMTPYSGKYIGYTIQKGKLSIDLKYLIAKKKLDAQNMIFFDQFTLGDKVESPDATKLPVRLAIALLKDRNGEIKLDVPVSGSIDDPKFSVGRIILQVILNLLAKAATSPFALLGALFGGGEELSYMEFGYGGPRVEDQNMKKLDILIKAMYDRPALKLDIEGHVDIERDKEGLKNYLVQKKVKVQRLNEMVKKGLPTLPIDEVRVEQQEYEKYLTMAYKAEKFAKPRTTVGFTKSLPVPEMEKLMLTHTVVNDEDLRTLATQRAMNTKDFILKSGKVTPDRVFIIEPKTLSPEKKEKLKDSRVDFKLK